MKDVTDGCYPPTWPRPPKAPVPEPEPDSLDEQVDWMTYSHPELYAMVHNGLDLTGAMSVSATWARLGDELADIGDELTRLLTATAQAWEGESAELARGSVSALADWSRETGTRTTEVSGCVTIQVDNATTARNAMPKPPYPVDPKGPAVTPMDAAFTSGDFASAAPLVADPAKYSSRERALHQQAASTMRQFQESSRDVYATVPRFVPPDLRKMPSGGRTEPVPQPQPPTPTGQPQPQPQPTAPAATPVTGGGAPVTSPGPAERTATPGPGSPLAPGRGAGAAEPTAARPAAAPSPAATHSSGGGAGMGVPMGGAPGGSGGEDTERKRKRYLEEDDDIWGVADTVMPPVIGEVNRRA